MAVLCVPYLPPSPNVMRGVRWTKHHAVRQECARAVWAALARLPHADRPRHRDRIATISLTVATKRGALPDPDNCWARVKPMIDALVDQGVLRDDSPRWMALGQLRVQRGGPSVSFTIEYAQASE